MIRQNLGLVFSVLFFSALKINAVDSHVAVSLRVPADNVLMTLTIESTEKTLEKREESIAIDRKKILGKALTVAGLTVVEVPEASQHRPYFKTSKISSFSLVGVPEPPQSGLSRISFEVRAKLGDGILVPDAVKRVRLLAQEATPIRLEMGMTGLQLIAKTQDIGEAHETVDASYDGDDLTIAFNAEYLLKGLEIAPGDDITLETMDNQKPAVLKSDEHPEFLYLLMPVRIS